MINYPTKKTPKQNVHQTQASVKNRGMRFEKLIDEANRYYVDRDIAVIHKKPIPIQIVKVHYPKRTLARIDEAYYKTPSTTDYNGIFQQYYIDFDVKETSAKTSFPLKNIHEHQIAHLKSIHHHGGIAFLLIHLKQPDETYLLGYETLQAFLKRAETGRKSITFSELRQKGYAIKEGFQPRMDYLKAVSAYIKDKTTL